MPSPPDEATSRVETTPIEVVTNTVENTLIEVVTDTVETTPTEVVTDTVETTPTEVATNTVQAPPTVLAVSTSESSKRSRITGTSSSTSNSSIRCRICQLTELETGEPVKSSDCRCKRDMANVHRSCLIDWVNYKGNNMCEICKTAFSSIPPPVVNDTPLTDHIVRNEMLRDYSLLNPMTFEKRSKICAGLLLLLFVLIITSSVGMSLCCDPPKTGLNHLPVKEENHMKFTLLVYSLCILVAVIITIAITWVIMEISYHNRRQRIHRHAVRQARYNNTPKR